MSAQKLIGTYLGSQAGAVDQLISIHSTPGNGKPLRINTDRSLIASTELLIAQESSSALSLRLGRPKLPQNGQFTENNQLARRFQDADQPDAISELGTPIYGRIILGKDGEENTWTDQQGKKGSYQTVALDCALCDVDFNSKIVKTDIQGLPYSITEFMSSGDSDVTITGIYNSTPGVAPVDFIINLNAIFTAPVPVPVTNYYLNANNIFYIKITPGTRMGQVEGEYATQRFTIKAWSDVPMSSMLP